MSPEMTALSKLPLARKLELLDELWREVTGDPTLSSMTDWHRTVLDERNAEYDRDPDAVHDWVHVRKEILGSGS